MEHINTSINSTDTKDCTHPYNTRSKGNTIIVVDNFSDSYSESSLSESESEDLSDCLYEIDNDDAIGGTYMKCNNQPNIQPTIARESKTTQKETKKYGVMV